MTKEQVFHILELKKNNSIRSISTITNIPLSTVRYWIKRAKAQGLDVPPNKKRQSLSLK